MSVSKSYRAVLPRLRQDEFERLQRWSSANCAVSAIFRDGGPVIWLASKERARSKDAWMRSVRRTLKRFLIDTTSIKGRNWLALASDDVVRSEYEVANPPRHANRAGKHSEPVAACLKEGATEQLATSQDVTSQDVDSERIVCLQIGAKQSSAKKRGGQGGIALQVIMEA